MDRHLSVDRAPSSRYDAIGAGYRERRAADPRIAKLIIHALGDARVVGNVGAGAGSYEPEGRTVVAIEPSARMIAQRPPGAGAAVRATAEALPVVTGGLDAVMALLTVHHWSDRPAGYAELRRVAPRRVVLTYEPAVHNAAWVVADYVPEIAELDARRPGFGAAEIARGIGGGRVTVVPVPRDCTDGFLMAYWGRPEALLEPGARRATSGFSVLDPGVVARAVRRLRDDLATGAWDRKYGHLRGLPEYDAGLRLVVAG